MYNKIIIATDLHQDFNEQALKAAKALVSESGSIIALHVMEPINNVVQSFLTKDAKSKAKETIKQMLTDSFAEVPHAETMVLEGQAGHEISKYAGKVGADCIIVGSHVHGLEEFLLGSTSARIVRHAKCSVHVIR